MLLEDRPSETFVQVFIEIFIAPKRAHPDLNQGPADLQSAALTTELCTHMTGHDSTALF